MIELNADNQRVLAALNGLLRQGQDLRPALQDLGEYFIASTKERFATQTAPDGTAWRDNAAVTALRKGHSKPLIGESGRLKNELHYRTDAHSVSWGSSLAYAGMQQHGGLKAAYPHLWGDIPARPFLGISEADEQAALAILQEHLAAPLGGGA